MFFLDTRKVWKKKGNVLVQSSPKIVYKSIGDALLHQNSLDGLDSLDGFWLAKVRTKGNEMEMSEATTEV